MSIFKRGSWLGRFYEFSTLSFYELSTPLILTVPFGAIFLIHSFFEQIGHLPALIDSPLGFALLVVLFFTPLVLWETIWLGRIIKRTKGYGWFKSQCFSFGMFLLLPLVITHLAKWLFVVIFLAKH